MKIEKVIMSCDDSHYQYYWPVVAKTCRKIIKATPVLFKITDNDSDFYFDGNGIVKNVKALPNINSGIQSLFYRIYGTKFFQDEVCLISDIDMLLLSNDYFQGTIKEYNQDSIVVYTSDAYDLNRSDSKDLFNTNVFGMCYNAAKGKVFTDVLNLNGNFEDFLKTIESFKSEKGLEWYGDEVYVTNQIEKYSSKYEVHKLTRGVEEGFVIKNRIEKWHFPVEYVNEQMKIDNVRDGNYNKKLLKEGYYLDCHCIRPYGFYENEINEVANIVCDKETLIQTIDGWDYSTVSDRCLIDDGDIVDIGCLNWDWSNFFLGKKRVIGVDPFENKIPFTEIYKGVIGNYNGVTKMKNEGIASSMINQDEGEEVQVKTWKDFCNEYNINKISVLKINIEGAEYDLLDSLSDEDYDNIDQIAISFHDWMEPSWKPKTEKAIELLKSKNYKIQKINKDWGWYLALKNKQVLPKQKFKKIVCISTFCDTEEKQNILKENIKKIKNLGIDVLTISPIDLPNEITSLCDYYYRTKENPLLEWPTRMYTHWYEMKLPNGNITTLQRGLADYGWAGLYQVKKLSQIALTYDYEIFYHMIYDLVIDDVVENELINNDVNIIHPRRDPHHPETLWETTLHFMVFDRDMMEKIEKEITLDEYLRTNGMAEGEVLKWKNKFNIPTSNHPVKDKIFYWGDYDFFNYSPFPDFKMFLSKNEPITIWLGEDPVYDTILPNNLRIVFHGFESMGPIEIQINGNSFLKVPTPWEIIEFPINSQEVTELILTYNNQTVNFTEKYNDIMMNQIYYNHRP